MLLFQISFYIFYDFIFVLRSKPLPKSRGPASLQPSVAHKPPTEDNHSLLTEEALSPLKSEFFGHFRGFTISPKKNVTEPSRPAPPVPVIPIIPPVIINNPKRSNSSVGNSTKTINKQVIRSPTVLPTITQSSNQSSSNIPIIPPALPPLNSCPNSRPVISSPILENSTCTAKELLSPLKNVPKIPIRPAPELPNANKENCRPISAIDTTNSTVIDEQKKPLNASALNRITSFLRQDRKPQTTTNNNSSQTSKKVIDKNMLRNLEISNPILQNEIKTGNTVPIPTESSAVVMRAQSMRGPTNMTRPCIPKFGSMRQGNSMKRPMSIPSGSRPKSPPPPRPPIPEIIKDKRSLISPPLPKEFTDYVQPCNMQKQNQYDDCLNKVSVKMDGKSPSSDNIYAVIDESPVTSEPMSPNPKNPTSNSGSNESFGLLGEIVTEIQSRNFDSIYSTSTLARKKAAEKKANAESKDTSETYMNTASAYKITDSVYSNMNNVKSSASSTSSGYITPSAVNPPIKLLAEDNQKKTNAGKTSDINLNTTTGATTTNSNVNNFQLTNKDRKFSNESIENNRNSKSNANINPSVTNKTIEKQGTPTIRSRRPSPSRSTFKPNPKSIPKSPKSNSPDLVTSCANKKPNGSNKPPDVLNGSMKKPTTITAKPHIPNLPKSVPKVNKPLNVKNNTLDIKAVSDNKLSVKNTKPNSASNETNSKVIPSGVRLTARQQSNVASLQQKFENKSSVSAKPIVVIKK